MYLNKNLLSTNLCDASEDYLDIYTGIPALIKHTIKPKIENEKEIISFNHPYTNGETNLAKNYVTYINDLFNTHQYLYLSMEIKNNFAQQQTWGNYGLKIYFWGKDEDEIVIIFDSKSFNGDIYNYKYYTQQGALINIEYLKNRIVGISKIILFYDEEMENNNNFLTDSDWIEINNLKINLVHETDLIDSMKYTNTVNAKLGYDLSTIQDTISLQPELSFNNTAINPLHIAKTEWYYRDNNVDQNSPAYKSIAGQGWHCFYPNENAQTDLKTIYITLNDNKNKTYNNHVLLSTDFICEQELMCIFEYSKHNNYFKTEPFIIKRKDKVENYYSFDIVENVSINKDNKLVAEFFLKYDFDFKASGYESLKTKWYWIENNWDSSIENNDPGLEEGMLVYVDSENETYKKYFLETEEADIISKLNISDKLTFWEGKFQLYCDVYGVYVDDIGLEYEEFLVHRSYTYDKKITNAEFLMFFNNYLDAQKQQDEATWNDASLARKYCVDNKIFSGTKENNFEWPRWIYLEEFIQMLYVAFLERIELSEKERLNPYQKKIKEYLNKYLEDLSVSNELNSSIASIWNDYVNKNYILKGAPKAWTTREEAVQMLYTVFTGELQL